MLSLLYLSCITLTFSLICASQRSVFNVFSFLLLHYWTADDATKRVMNAWDGFESCQHWMSTSKIQLIILYNTYGHQAWKIQQDGL